MQAASAAAVTTEKRRDPMERFRTLIANVISNFIPQISPLRSSVGRYACYKASPTPNAQLALSIANIRNQMKGRDLPEIQKIDWSRGMLVLTKTVQIGNLCTVSLQLPINGILGICNAGIGMAFSHPNNACPLRRTSAPRSQEDFRSNRLQP